MCEEIEFEIQEEDIPLTMNLEDDVYLVEPKTESLEVTPTKETQYFESETGIYYDNVTVNPIPDEYIIPNGNLEINQNGTYDVNNYSSAEVNVPEKVLGTKTITSNGTYNATDDNLDGYSQVSVETSGVDINDYFNNTITTGSSEQSGWVRCIKKIPSLIFNGSNASYLFAGCWLSNVDLSNIDMSNVTNANHMFENCKIENVDFSHTNTSNLKSANYMFFTLDNEQAPISISKLDFGKVESVSYLFSSGYFPRTQNLGGFENYGKAFSTTISANFPNYELRLRHCSSLTEQSIINVLNNLYDIATKGCNTQSVMLGSTNLAKLTSEAGKQALQTATERGWSIR